jgi:hypothetical protein
MFFGPKTVPKQVQKRSIFVRKHVDKKVTKVCTFVDFQDFGILAKSTFWGFGDFWEVGQNFRLSTQIFRLSTQNSLLPDYDPQAVHATLETFTQAVPRLIWIYRVFRLFTQNFKSTSEDLRCLTKSSGCPRKIASSQIMTSRLFTQLLRHASPAVHAQHLQSRKARIVQSFQAVHAKLQDDL